MASRSDWPSGRFRPSRRHPDGGVVLGADQNPRGAASWKRYRGGTAGKAWIDVDGTGRYRRFAADLDGQIEDPQWWDGRVVFLSDHEGWGNVYSLAPDGTDLRRHSDHGDAYARDADGDGGRLVYGCFGDLWILDSLAADSAPRRLELRLGSARYGRVRYPLQAAEAVGRIAPDRTGRASALDVRGAAVWCTHRDGPARVLSPGGRVRARFTTPLGDEQVVWVTDADGEDGLEVTAVTGGPGSPAGRRGARPGGRAGRLARWRLGGHRRRRRGGAGHRRRRRRDPGARSLDVRHRQWAVLLAGLSMAGLGGGRAARRRGGPAPDQARRRRRRGGARSDAAAIPRSGAGLHPGRALPGLPVAADLRPGLRPAALRPVVSGRHPSLPPAPRGGDARPAVAGARRPRPAVGARHGDADPRRERRRGREAQPASPRSPSSPTGSRPGWSSCPSPPAGWPTCVRSPAGWYGGRCRSPESSARTGSNRSASRSRAASSAWTSPPAGSRRWPRRPTGCRSRRRTHARGPHGHHADGAAGRPAAQAGRR